MDSTTRRRRSCDPTTEFVDESELITLRIAGLGHHFELDIKPTATLLALKEEIESRTDLPAPYQRLIAKNKKLDDDSLVLGPTILEGNMVKELGAGLEDRTKLLLLHSPAFVTDKEGVDKLTDLMDEIEKVDLGRRNRDFDNKTVHELITQLCCKIDGVETNGSEALRKLRKQTIRKAEEVAKKSDASRRGIDP